MDALIMHGHKDWFNKKNKFASQKIRKKYIERHNISGKKSKNYEKHKIRKNSFIRQSLKAHINHDFANYDYNYNLSQCACDFDSNDNDSVICEQCLAKGFSTQSSDIAVKTDTETEKEMSKISQNNTSNQAREQEFEEYFGYDYRLSKTKPSKLNLGKNIKNYTRKHNNHDRLHLLLHAIFRESFYNTNDDYPTFLFLPNDICKVISNYIFGKTWLSHSSKRAIAGIYWFANIINDFMNDRTNQCELERNCINSQKNINKNSASKERCRFNILEFIHVGRNTLTDILLSRGNVDKIDIVLDMYQLTRHFEQHLKLYHSNHKSVLKPEIYCTNPTTSRKYWHMRNFDCRWQKNVDYNVNHGDNINCKCIFWQYYYNNGKVISDMDCITPPRDLFEFEKYVCKHRYCLNIGFIATIFDDILRRLKIDPNTWQWVGDSNKMSERVYDRQDKRILKCCTMYIYNGFDLADFKFQFYNSNDVNNYDCNCKCRDMNHMIEMKKSIINYCNFANMRYYMCRSGNCNLERNGIEINVPLYPFKLQPHLFECDYFSMINPMLIDLNSFVINSDNNNNHNNNNNSDNNIKYNLKTLVKNWNCNYNYEIYQMNKRGLIYLSDIEKRTITTPKNGLINECTFHIYFWKLVQFCETLWCKNELHFWNIDKNLKLIKKYCHENNSHFWNLQDFVSKFLTYGIKDCYEYYPHLSHIYTTGGYYCCYYEMKTDNDNKNNRKRNVYLARFKVFKYLGFDKMLKLKILNDKSFSKKFVEIINGRQIITSLPMKMEFNYCLIQFNYLSWIKYDLKRSKVSHNTNKFQFKIDDIVKCCIAKHKHHASPKYRYRENKYSWLFDFWECCRQLEKQQKERWRRVKFEAKLLEKLLKEQKREGIKSDDGFGQLNEYLVDAYAQHFTRKGDKKFDDRYRKRLHYRKKKPKKHKLFKQTKKTSKKRSKHQKIMDKKNNKKSKRQKYQKQNLMLTQLDYTKYPYAYV